MSSLCPFELCVVLIIALAVMLGMYLTLVRILRQREADLFQNIDDNPDVRLCKRCMSLQIRKRRQVYGRKMAHGWKALTPPAEGCECSDYAFYRVPQFGSEKIRQGHYPTYAAYAARQLGRFVFTRKTGVADSLSWEIYDEGDFYPVYAYSYATLINLLRKGAISEKEEL